MTTTKQQQPTATYDPKYTLEANVSGHRVIAVFAERPTMDSIKNECGEGTHNLYNGEGKLLRRFVVTTNRNGNLKIQGFTAEGLEAVSTINLHRLAKQYVRIVKVWPAKLNDVKALQKELQRRDTLIEEAIDAAKAVVAAASKPKLKADEDPEVADAAAALAQAVAESKAAREKVSV